MEWISERSVRRGCRLALVFSLLGVVLVNSGCGGGSSELPPTRPSGNVSGVAFDGTIMNGTVSIYDFKDAVKGELLAPSGVTNEAGRYSINLASPDRPVLIEITGGLYVEEASGTLVSLAPGQALRAADNYVSGRNLVVSVTYFTNLAAGLSQFFVSTGQTVPDAISQANAAISAMAGVNIRTTSPIDITVPSNGVVELSDGYRYGFLTAAVSQWTKWVSEQHQQPPHSLHSSISFAQRAYDDIRADGRLDGQGADGILSIGSIPLTPEVYRNDIALNVLLMANSARNATGIGPTELIGVAEGYNGADLEVDIFSGAPAMPFSSAVPVIGGLSYDDNDRVAGTITFAADVIDPIGLNSVSFEVDGKEVAVSADNANPFVQIDTTVLEDGPHDFKIVAVNLLNHSASTEVSLVVSNRETFIGSVTPQDGSYVRGIFMMSASAGDPIGLSSVSFAIDDGIGIPADDINNPMVEINSADIADGEHKFSVFATNTVGSTHSHTVNYVVDNSPPVATLTDISDGAFVHGSLPVTGAVQDANGIASARLFFDGALYTQFDDLSEIVANIDTTAVADGVKPISLVATDVAGNTSTASVEAVVDNTAPVVLIEAMDTLVAKTITVTGEVEDINGIVSAKLFLNDVVQADFVSPVEINTTIDTQSFDDGDAIIKLEAEDVAGNMNSATRDITIDNTRPTVTLDIPDGAFAMREVVVSGTVTDANGISNAILNVDDKLHTTFENFENINTSIDTTTLGDGPIAVSLFARDKVGNGRTKNVNLIVDNTNPHVAFSNIEDGQYVFDNVTVNGTANDANGIVKTELFFAGVSQPALDDFEQISANIDTNAVPDGETTLALLATDSAGNQSAQARRVVIDNTAPSVTMDEIGEHVSGTISVSGEVDDTIGIASAGLFVDGKEHANFSEFSSILHPFDTQTLSDGEHEFALRAQDQAGHSTVTAQRAVVDNNPPVVQIITPLSNSYVNDDFNVTADVADTVGVTKVEVSVGDGEPLSVSLTENPIRHPVEVSEIGEGPHVFTVTAFDAIGNRSSSIASNVFVDTVNPILTVADTYRVSALVRGCDVAVTLSDSGSGLESVVIDGEDRAPITGTFLVPLKIRLNTSAIFDFTAMDKAGNIASFPRCIRYSNDILRQQRCAPC